MLDYPAQTFVRFFNNHGLLTVGPQLQWRTVSGGSRSYVERIVAPLRARARLDLAHITVIVDNDFPATERDLAEVFHLLSLLECDAIGVVAGQARLAAGGQVLA